MYLEILRRFVSGVPAWRSLGLLAALLLSASFAAAQTAPLEVVRPDGSTVSLTARQLGALAHETVAAQSHDKSATYDGVDVLAVLKAAGVEPPSESRGTQLRRVLLVRAADGYAVAFSFAELDPSLGKKRVFLSGRVENHEMADSDGPWRLVVPSETRPTRWVRRVFSLAVIDLR